MDANENGQITQSEPTALEQAKALVAKAEAEAVAEANLLKTSLEDEFARLKEHSPALHDFFQSVKAFMDKFAAHSGA